MSRNHFFSFILKPRLWHWGWMRKMALLAGLLMFNSTDGKSQIPVVNINLSASTDTSVTILDNNSIDRKPGITCGVSSGGSNCIIFNITVNSASDQISFDILGASGSLSSAAYQVNCNSYNALSTPICLNGITTVSISFCKNGKNPYDYKITASTLVKGSADLTLRQNCSGTMSVTGLQASSVTWTSIFPGSAGSYNGYLSSPNGAVSTTVTPAIGAPAYIDYRVSGSTTSCGNAKADTIRIYTTPPLSIPISPANPAICSNTPITLTASPSGGNPPYTYSWSPGGETVAAKTVNVAGTYTVTVNDNTSGCAAVPQSITVTALPTPVAPTAAGTTICAGTIATVTASAPGGTYQWYDAPAGGNLLFTGASYTTSTLNSTTNYYVQTTVSGCTSPRTTVTVTVTPTPAAPAVTPATICAGNTAVLGATGSGTLDWFAAASGGSSLQTGSSYTTVVLNTSATYYVQRIVSGCVSTRTPVTATVNPIPAAPTAPSTAICTGSSVTLNATAPGGVYSWYNVASGGSPAQTGASYITPVLSSNTSYYVETMVSGCISARTTVSISVNATPPAPVINATGICTGNTANITLNSPLSGVTYEWYSAASGGTLLATGTSYTTPVLTTNTDYFVQANLAGCSSSGRIATTVTVSNIPTVPLASPATICSGNTASLSATGSGTLDWYAAASGGSLLQTGTGFTTAVLISSTSFYVQNTVLGCASPRTSVAVTVNPIPSAPTAADATICIGTSAVLTANASGSGTYDWFTVATGGSSVFTGASFTTPVLNATTIYYVQTTVSACASSRTTVTVTANPIPAAPGVSVIPICSGNTTVATINSPISGITYQWYDAAAGGTLLATGTGYATPVLAATTSYYAQASQSGCSSSRATATVSVTPTPAPPLASAATICSGNSTAITATAPGILDWYAAVSGGSPLQTGSSYTTPVLSASTIYYVQTTVSGCSSVRASITVPVTPIPAAPTVANAATCNGSSAILTATAPGGVYDWFTGASGGPSVFTGSSFTTPVLNANTSYYVQTVVSGCTSARSTVNVSVNATPPLPVVDPMGICTGNTATVSVNSPLSGVVYEWYTAPSGGAVLASDVSSYTTPVLTAATDYYVQATLTGCSSSGRVMTTVTVSSIPPAPSAAGAAICTGNTASLAATGSGTIDWFSNVSGGSSLKTGTTYTTPVLNTSTTYYVQTNVSGCASTRTSVTVTVNNAVPTAPVAANAAICIGSSTVLSATSPGGTYEWYTVANGGSPVYTGVNFTTPVLNTSATYYVQTTVSTCTSSRTMVTVTTNAIPAIPATTSAPVCAGNTTTITVTTPVAGVVYQWYDAPSAGNLLASGNSFTTAVLSSNANYYVQANFSGCASNRVTAAVPVTSIPVVPVAQDVFICTANTAIVTATSPGGTYEWYDAATGGSLLSTGANYITPVLSFTTRYYVQTTVAGCTGSRTTVTVNVNPAPPAPTVAGSTICAGNNVSLTATAPGGIYQWYDAAAGGNLLLTGFNYITPSLNSTTTYYVQSTVTGCTGSRTPVPVTVTQPPAAPTVAGASVCAGSGTILSASAPGGIYQWYDAVSGGNLLNTGVSYNIPSISNTTTFYVQTTVGFCTGARKAVTITVNPIPAAPTSSGGSICAGTSVTLTASGPAGTYQWYDSTVSGNLLTSGTSFTTPVLNTTTAYYVQVNQSGCTSARTVATANVIPIQQPSFHYPSGTLCVSGSNATPTITGGPGGVFSATPTGLVFANTGTGEINATASALGTYTINYITGGTCVYSSTAKITITNAPDARFVYSGPVCPQQLTALPDFSPGANAGVFTAVPGGLLFRSNSTGDIDLQKSTPGTYTLTNTIAASGSCAAAVAAGTLTILPQPFVSAGVDQNICAGTPVSLNGSVSGSASAVNWSGGAGSFTNASQTSAQYVPAAGETIVKLYATTDDPSGPCIAAVDSLTLFINPLPTPPVVQDASICTGNTAILFAISPGGVYEWFDSQSGPVIATGNTFTTPVLTANHTYYAQSIVNSCTGPKTAVTVTVSTKPSVTSAPAGEVCSAQSFTYLITSNQVGTSYTWARSAVTGISNPAFNSQTDSSITEVLNNTTNNIVPVTYSIIPTSKGCIGDPFFYTASIKPTPATPSINNSTPVCAGTPLNLFTNAVTGASYLWSGPNGFSSTQQNPVLTNITTASAGIYQLRITVNNCTSSPSAKNIAPVIAAPTAASNSPVCEQSNLRLTAGALAGASYSWKGPAGFSSINQNPILSSVNSGQAGMYYVTASIAGCTGLSDSVSVTINVPPATPSITSNSPVCSSDSITLKTSSIIPNMVFQWSGPAGFKSNSPSPLIHTADKANEGLYNLTVSTPGCTITSASSLLVLVNQTPQIASVSNNGPLCEGDILLLKASSLPGAAYSWSSLSGYTSLVQNPSVPNITKANEESYRVFATLNGCMSDTVATTVAITKKSIASAGSNRIVCANKAPVSLIGNITGDDTQTGTWRTDGTGSFFPNASQLSSTYIPSASDTAKRKILLTLQTTNNKVCPVSASSLEITVTPAPVVNAGADGLVCANDSLITVSGKIFNATGGAWSASGSGIFQQGSSSLTSVYTPSRADILRGNVRLYLVSVINGDCLPVTDTVSYIIQPAPVLDAGNELIIFENETARLNPQVTGTGNFQFLWTPNKNLSSDTARNPLVTGKDNQTYMLYVTGTGGCVSTDTIPVKVLKPFIIPNIFTPNGDGIHDTWRIPELNNYPGSIVEIFTRTGQKIFSSIGYEQPWDGTYNGKPVPVATYYYIIKPNFRNQVFSGSVTVVR
jgi:gliding motility-associated-like protein